MKIQITFLGTAQAIPTATRNHTAILLSYANENILIDCGEGTQRQFRKAKISPTKITKLLITHWHGDHVLGLPGLFQTLALSNYSKTLEIYGPRGTKKFIDLLYRLFIHKNKIKIKVKEISSGKFFSNQDFYLEAFPMQHGAPTLSYRFIERDKLRLDKAKIKKLNLPGRLLGKLASGKNIKYKGKTFNVKSLSYSQPGKIISIILDTKLNPNCYKSAKQADLLIAESTYSNKETDLASSYKHLTSQQAAKIAKQAKVKKLVLTHISQRYDHKEKIILNEAKKIFKNVSIAEDLDTLEL